MPVYLLWGALPVIYRRKFKNHISDNMDRWKSRGGKSQRRERKKSEDQKRERVSRKKIKVCETIFLYI